MHVAIGDRRLDAAGAVALHPALAAHSEALEPLSEVFDHVIALRFAVHEEAEADLLLQANHVNAHIAHAGRSIGER